MARELGTFIFSANYEVEKQNPIDARLRCPLYTDMLGTTSDMPYPYLGMVVAVTDDPDATLNGVYVRVANEGVSESTGTDWKKIDGRIASFAVINNPTDGDFAGTADQIIRITQSNGSSEADTFFDIDSSAFGGGGFRFLGLATDHGSGVSDLGFLENETTYDFLAGDVFRIKNSDSIDGLYYVPADVTLESFNFVLWATTWTNAITSGDIVLFHEDVEPGNQLYITEVPDGTAMIEDHGGLAAGTLAEDIGDGSFTLSQMLDQILFPAVCPTVSSQPNVTLSDNVNPNLEIIGDTINITFTTGATGGSLSDGSTYAGDLTAATLTGSGSTNESLAITAPYGIADYTLNNYTVVSGTQSWTLTGTFAQGAMPVDNFGADCADVQYTGGTDTASVSFEGVYPVYAGNSTTYVGSASGTWTSASVNTTYWTQLSLFSFSSPYFQWDQSYNEDGVAPDVVRHRFVIPADLTVTDVQQFSTASNSYGSIGTSGFTQTNVTLDLFGNSVNYVVWEKNVSPGGSAQYRVYFS